LAGCGGGGSGEVVEVVAAARAPLVAGVHRDVRAFCAAYTAQAARRLVLERKPRVAGGCEAAVRFFVDDPWFAQVDRRDLADLRVSDVVIQGRRARARVRETPGNGAGSVETFREARNGRWQIASLDHSSGVTTVIR
jgi:hypothetical protein